MAVTGAFFIAVILEEGDAYAKQKSASSLAGSEGVGLISTARNLKEGD